MMDQVIHDAWAKGYDRASALIRVRTALAGFGYDLKVEELHRHQCEALAVAASEYSVWSTTTTTTTSRASWPAACTGTTMVGTTISAGTIGMTKRTGRSCRGSGREAPPRSPTSRPTRPPDPRCRRRHLLPARGARPHKGRGLFQ